jgi:shikimate dehydrogenase
VSTPDRYAVIGHPIAHSLSPRIHALFAEQTRQQLLYGALDVTPEQLRSSVQEFFASGGRGLNVTIPHKQTVMALIERLSARAERAGAVNTIALERDRRLFGDNTDGVGLLRDLTLNLQLSLRQRRILLLGAGGAARGVIGPLLSESPREFVIANRTEARARELARLWPESASVRAMALEELEASAFDLIINATPPAAEASLPTGRSTLGPDVTCYDMAYGSTESAFLRWARASGAARRHDGLGMLVEQAAESFQLWRGVQPNTAPVLAALREAHPITDMT